MKAIMRTAAVAGLATVVVAAAAPAQIPGMPLFTNPRYGSGFRIHADMGTNLGDQKISFSSAQVYQAGITFAIGMVGISANVGMTKADFQGIQQCNTGTGTNCNAETKATGSALAQLRIVGNTHEGGALSVFGGISADFRGYDTPEFQANCAPAGPIPATTCDSLAAKILTIPVGVSAGFKLGPATLWGAPRYVMYRASGCGTGATAFCNARDSEFRYAVGADLPLFGVLAIRAAYDGGKFQGQNVNRLGVGASVGIGGVH